MLDFCKKFAGELSELSASQVDRRRKYIYKLVRERIEEEGIPLTPHNMNIVFTKRLFDYILDLYDEHFFDYGLLSTFRENKCCITICLDNRCTRVGGKCWHKGKSFTIKISSKVLKRSFMSDHVKRTVGNIGCETILECILLFVEHELTHAILGCDCIDSAYSDSKDLTYGTYNGETNPGNGHSKTFMGLMHNRFGHTGYLHSVSGVSPNLVTKKKFNQNNLKKGETVLVRFKIHSKDKAETHDTICKIIKLNKKTCNIDIIDTKVLKLLNYSHDRKPDTINTKYHHIVDIYKLESHIEDKSHKTLPPPKTQNTQPLPKDTKHTKKMCTTINPEPPCKTGFYEKVRPNGAICCYKSQKHPSQIKKFKFKTKQKNIKPTTDKYMGKLQNTLLTKTQTGCNQRNPTPPCKSGYYTRSRPNGAICCYKK